MTAYSKSDIGWKAKKATRHQQTPQNRNLRFHIESSQNGWEQTKIRPTVKYNAFFTTIPLFAQASQAFQATFFALSNDLIFTYAHKPKSVEKNSRTFFWHRWPMRFCTVRMLASNPGFSSVPSSKGASVLYWHSDFIRASRFSSQEIFSYWLAITLKARHLRR